MDKRLELFNAACVDAGKEIMSIYSGEISVAVKSDQSPVTIADKRAEQIILAALRKNYPDIPIVAEEEMAAGKGPAEIGDQFILVDPLDGTKEFINKTNEFTVNIALIEGGKPVMGSVYAPAMQTLYYGQMGFGAYEQAVDCVNNSYNDPVTIKVDKVPVNNLIAVASASHRSQETQDFLDQLNVTEVKSMGSSLKLCLVASGQAHLYPRLGRTMEWDIAAGHAVLLAAGGEASLLDGHPLTYGKPNYENPHFVAWGKQTGEQQ